VFSPTAVLLKRLQLLSCKPPQHLQQTHPTLMHSSQQHMVRILNIIARLEGVGWHVDFLGLQPQPCCKQPSVKLAACRRMVAVWAPRNRRMHRRSKSWASKAIRLADLMAPLTISGATGKGCREVLDALLALPSTSGRIWAYGKLHYCMNGVGTFALALQLPTI